MARLLVLALFSSFLLSISCAPLTRKILSSDPPSLKNTTKITSSDPPSLKNTTGILSSDLPPLKNKPKILSSDKNSTKLFTSNKNTTKLLTGGKNITKSLTSTKTAKLSTVKNNQTTILTPASKNQTILLKSPPKMPSNSSIAPKIPKKASPVSNPWFSQDPLEEQDEDDSDLIAEFRDLPSKFHQTLLPDLVKISSTSKTYLSKANKKLTNQVKPFFGKRYASAVAAAISLLPILILLLILRHVRHHLSLQRIILFSHGYLAIYFSVLFLCATITGLEPLKLFFSSSPTMYVGIQLAQAAGYILFLMVQMVQMVAAPGRAAALPQTAVAVAVGLHYYMAVFHKAVEGEAPKTSWKAHGIYAACFLSLFGISSAVRNRKKGYGEDDGKNS